MGNAYAGAAAVAEDATTVWWNPAGMSRLPKGMHVSVGARGNRAVLEIQRQRQHDRHPQQSGQKR